MIIGMIVAVLILAAALIFFNWERIVRHAAEGIIAQERARYEDRINRLEKDIATLVEETTAAADETGTEPETAVYVTTEDAGGSEVGRESDCQRLKKRIIATISDLENRPYIIQRQLKNGLLPKLEDIRGKLLDHPPIVVRETDSLYSILTNTAHFYRVLGKEDLLLLYDLMNKESDSIEEILDLFYQWSEKEGDCGEDRHLFEMPLEKLYEYAGFFLNTLGGQAYIFRRDTKTRILARYYCIMIIDRANTRIINRHGIDLRPAIDSLIRELRVAPPLKYRERYLDRLANLKARYADDQGPGA